jgi:hypothetical protein
MRRRHGFDHSHPIPSTRPQSTQCQPLYPGQVTSTGFVLVATHPGIPSFSFSVLCTNPQFASGSPRSGSLPIRFLQDVCTRLLSPPCRSYSSSLFVLGCQPSAISAGTNRLGESLPSNVDPGNRQSGLLEEAGQVSREARGDVTESSVARYNALLRVRFSVRSDYTLSGIKRPPGKKRQENLRTQVCTSDLCTEDCREYCVHRPSIFFHGSTGEA